MYPQPRRRRNYAPFIIAIILAGALIVGLRIFFGGGDDDRPGTVAEEKLACGDGGVRLTLLSSVEKAGLLRKIAGEYNGKEVAGRCADVAITTSGGALQAFERGWDERVDGPRPDAWSPASSSWLTLIRQRTENSDKGAILGPDNPSIAKTPLVIAMPKPMAQALGWPGKKLGWADVLELSNDPKGWAKHGHPEWGRFRLGKTNPNFSTSGMNATIGAYFAATGLSGDLSAKNVADARTRAFVQGVERSIVHYGDTTLTFLSNLQHADDAGSGLSYISAVTVEEKSVWDYNQGNPTGDPATLGKHAKPKVPLVAIYPKEGTLFSDNPFAVLAWADEAKKQVAADFLAHLRAPEQQEQFADFAFRTHEGKAGKLITEANGLLPAEPKATLNPPVPGVLDKILQSWAELRKPANVLMVMDTSGSMEADVPGTGKSKLELAKQAAINALPQFGSHDKVGLWMFSTQRDGKKDHLELSAMSPMTAGHRAELKKRLGDLIPEGGTGLYDTTLAAYREVLGQQSGDTINAVVFLTDGKNEDTTSVSLDNLLPDLRAERGADSVRIFTIAYGEDADLNVLRQISQTTDAAAYDSRKPGSIDQVFTAVVSNF